LNIIQSAAVKTQELLSCHLTLKIDQGNSFFEGQVLDGGSEQAWFQNKRKEFLAGLMDFFWWFCLMLYGVNLLWPNCQPRLPAFFKKKATR